MSTQITARIDDELLKRLDEKAKAEKRTRAAQVEWILEAALPAKKAKR